MKSTELVLLYAIVVYFCVIVFIVWKIYEYQYYSSNDFKLLKDKINNHIKECNELNNHIEELKNTPLAMKPIDYGVSSYSDTSIYNYKRPRYRNLSYAPYVHNCSRTVLDNARKQPFKYVCKYFNIKADEENLSVWENVLNNYSSAENGKNLLINRKNEIMNGIYNELPILIRFFSKKLEKKLGFDDVDLKNVYFPRYIFTYVSSGGYSSGNCEIIFDIDNLNRFVIYLSEIVKFKKSVQGQRALMTSKLRQDILNRDNYTCKLCGISSKDEPHLLLEVDHITPLSKGGITSVENLQTLCWKCNRTKGAKI